jgi:hypothetical protein
LLIHFAMKIWAKIFFFMFNWKHQLKILFTHIQFIILLQTILYTISQFSDLFLIIFEIITSLLSSNVSNIKNSLQEVFSYSLHPCERLPTGNHIPLSTQENHVISLFSLLLHQLMMMSLHETK